MAGKLIDQLSDIQIRNAKPKEKQYKLTDGRGLFLLVMPNGSKYWRMKYRYGGKEKLLALGVYPDLPLSAVRKSAQAAREQLAIGEDPSALKKQQKIQQKVNSANSFEAVAKEWFDKQTPHWSPGNVVRIKRFIEKYLNPYLGHRPIVEITPPELLQAVRKKESQGTLETARRTLRTAGQIFRYAVATGRAERDISLDLKGALARPISSHFASITTPREAGKLLRDIDHYEGTAVVSAALKLAPLVFVRPGELRTMKWEQINWDENYWEYVKGRNTKVKTPHRVPLSKQAISVLKELEPLTRRSVYVFPSARGASKPMSDNALNCAIRNLGYSKEQMTAHGFRAMARTLLDEELNFDFDWIEHQLAHSVKDANGRAYNRTTFHKQRAEMMQTWADYLDNIKNTIK